MNTTLIGSEELAAHLGKSHWRIFDCRHDLANVNYGAAAYAREHLPGASFLHCDHDLSGPPTGNNGRHPLPAPASFAAQLGKLGVGAQTQVVAYDNEGGVFASRLWWMLRWLGHPAVAVLDGGLAAWKRAKLPLEALTATPAALPFAVHAGEAAVSVAAVRENLEAKRFLLVDARRAERFRGENETLDPVAGRIPGAVNRFYGDNLDENGIHFKTATELAAEFASLIGHWQPREVVHYCGSGVSACHNILAMEVAGLAGSRLYPGSWSEWCSDPARPIAQG